MIRLLIRRFVPGHENTGDPMVRTRYVFLAGILGIVCNLILFGVKLAVGTLMNSVAIASDALNNLSDSGSSLVSMVSARLAAQRPDREHPYGHGRMEYVASLVVAFLILHVGLDQLVSSFDKLIHPEPVRFQWVPILILGLSVLVKVWMWSYNRYIAKKIDSSVLRAASADSANDTLATGAVIVATVIGTLLPKVPVDGIMGILVSLLILKAGFEIARDTVGLLLGSAPDPDTVKALSELIEGDEMVEGVHDMMLHDYGPGRMFASAHAEVSDQADIILAHEHIDALEQKIFRETGIITVLHMDPITVGSEKVNAIKAQVLSLMAEVDPIYTLHDFRITDGEAHINLIFDVVVPIGEAPDDTVRKISSLRDKIKGVDGRYAAVIAVDHSII